MIIHSLSRCLHDPEKGREGRSLRRRMPMSRLSISFRTKAKKLLSVPSELSRTASSSLFRGVCVAASLHCGA